MLHQRTRAPIDSVSSDCALTSKERRRFAADDGIDFFDGLEMQATSFGFGLEPGQPLRSAQQKLGAQAGVVLADFVALLGRLIEDSGARRSLLFHEAELDQLAQA